MKRREPLFIPYRQGIPKNTDLYRKPSQPSRGLHNLSRHDASVTSPLVYDSALCSAMGCPASTGKFAYKRHEPEKTLLYQVLQEHLETWLAERQADTSRSPLPAFVEKELRAFMRCGILAHGFIMLSCDACQALLPVAYSCKCRGFCPSCGAKRMAETTAHLIDNVLPHAPFRQWVVTVPHALRYWMARSRRLTNLVHGIVSSEIMAYYEAKAKDRGIDEAIPGGVTFIQRFGSALNLNIHYHILVLDGVYSVKGGTPRFFHLKGPDDDDISLVVETIATKVIAMLRENNYLSEEGTEVDMPPCLDQIIEDSEQLKAAIAASATMHIAFGENAGKKVRRVGHGFGIEEEHALVKGKRCSSANGFTVHANRYVGEDERKKLEELVGYVSRPAFSNKRLSLRDPDNPNGDLIYELKTPWRDGTEGIILSRSELCEKISALIPPPYIHLSRYFGVFSSHSKWRRLIVIKPHVKKGFVAVPDGSSVSRMTWSKLLKRAFKIDVTRCQACGARIYPENCQDVNVPNMIPPFFSPLASTTCRHRSGRRAIPPKPSTSTRPPSTSPNKTCPGLAACRQKSSMTQKYAKH